MICSAHSSTTAAKIFLYQTFLISFALKKISTKKLQPFLWKILPTEHWTSALQAQFSLRWQQKDRQQAKWQDAQVFSRAKRESFLSKEPDLQKLSALAATAKEVSTSVRFLRLLRQAADSRWQSTATAQYRANQKQQIFTRRSELKSKNKKKKQLILLRKQISVFSWRRFITARDRKSV